MIIYCCWITNQLSYSTAMSQFDGHIIVSVYPYYIIDRKKPIVIITSQGNRGPEWRRKKYSDLINASLSPRRYFIL